MTLFIQSSKLKKHKDGVAFWALSSACRLGLVRVLSPIENAVAESPGSVRACVEFPPRRSWRGASKSPLYLGKNKANSCHTTEP